MAALETEKSAKKAAGAGIASGKVAVKTESKAENGKIAILLIRGMTDMTQPMLKTLELLHLSRKNQVVVIADNPVSRGMANKVKDFVTWGEINAETFKELVQKRGEEYLGRLQDSKGTYDYNVVKIEGKVYKPYFRLNPPRKGFGRKGIKIAFSVGGALGYRGAKINDLLMRMI